MRKLWPLLTLLLPGCTFFSWSDGVKPRTASDIKDVNPGLYLILAVFCLILVGSVLATLFKETPKKEPFSGPSDKDLSFFLAVLAGLVVLLLTA